MSARSDLAGLIAAVAPDTWDVIPFPKRLRTFEDPDKPVAVVVEQRTVAAGQFSPDGVSIPVQVELAVWVIVDATRGDEEWLVEDRLEEAVEEMIRILTPMPEHVWDGTAARDEYDPQKPAYQFTIRAAGALTPEE